MKALCGACGHEVESLVETRRETYPVKGTPVEITATVRVCAECGEAIWDDTLDNQNLIEAFNSYRRQNGLLMPEEIKRIREKYGLSQAAFARILGLGEKTITRYENGSLQDEGINNLILLMDNPANFRLLKERQGPAPILLKVDVHYGAEDVMDEASAFLDNNVLSFPFNGDVA